MKINLWLCLDQHKLLRFDLSVFKRFEIIFCGFWPPLLVVFRLLFFSIIWSPLFSYLCPRFSFFCILLLSSCFHSLFHLFFFILHFFFFALLLFLFYIFSFFLSFLLIIKDSLIRSFLFLIIVVIFSLFECLRILIKRLF